MSESQETFDKIGKEHRALYEEIVKHANEIAGAMVVGSSTLVNGVWVRSEHVILEKIAADVRKKLWNY